MQAHVLAGRGEEARAVPRPGISLHFLEDEGVLLDTRRQELYAINTVATFIWCCLEEHLGTEVIAERLAAVFGVSHSEARTYVSDILARWKDLQLIDDPRRPVAAIAPPCPPDPGPSSAWQTVPAQVGKRKDERDYRILDLHFRLRVSSESLLEQVEPLLAPFALGGYARMDLLPVSLDYRAGRYVFGVGDEDIERCASPSEVVPMLKAGLLYLAFQHSSDFAALHAAAVGRNGRCIVLPAASGGGKSTLTAALVRDGLRLLGDDTVVLSDDGLSARAVPFAICLKKGAWGLLADYFPALERQPVHDRLDGKRVRYLTLPPTALHTGFDGHAVVSAIVFLRRRPAGATALVDLSATEALRRLLEGFCPLGDGLSAGKVDRLLKWIDGVNCYELRFSSIDDGVAQLRSIYP